MLFSLSLSLSLTLSLSRLASRCSRSPSFSVLFIVAMISNANSNNNSNNDDDGASASARPRSPRSLEIGAVDATSTAGGFVDVRLSVAVPPSPFRSTFSAAGGTAKAVASVQNTPRATEGGVRIVFKVRDRRVANELGYSTTMADARHSRHAPVSSSALFLLRNYPRSTKEMIVPASLRTSEKRKNAAKSGHLRLCEKASRRNLFFLRRSLSLAYLDLFASFPLLIFLLSPKTTGPYLHRPL